MDRLVDMEDQDEDIIYLTEGEEAKEVVEVLACGLIMREGEEGGKNENPDIGRPSGDCDLEYRLRQVSLHDHDYTGAGSRTEHCWVSYIIKKMSSFI